MDGRDTPHSFSLWLLADKDTCIQSVHVGFCGAGVGYCFCIVTYSCHPEDGQWAYYIPHWHETRGLDSGHIRDGTSTRHVIQTRGILETALPRDTWSRQWAYQRWHFHETRDLDSGHIRDGTSTRHVV